MQSWKMMISYKKVHKIRNSKTIYIKSCCFRQQYIFQKPQINHLHLNWFTPAGLSINFKIPCQQSTEIILNSIQDWDFWSGLKKKAMKYTLRLLTAAEELGTMDQQWSPSIRTALLPALVLESGYIRQFIEFRPPQMNVLI